MANCVAGVAFLLQHKVNVNAKDGLQGGTALGGAALRGHVECAKLLLDAKAEVDLPDQDDRTPLFTAAENNFTRTVNLLLEHKANAKARDRFGRTPIDACTLAWLRDRLLHSTCEPAPPAPLAPIPPNLMSLECDSSRNESSGGPFRLPAAVLSHLLSFLDTHTLARHVFPVCKAFRARSTDAKLYTDLKFTSSCDAATAKRLVELAGPHLQSLTLTHDEVLPVVARRASPARLRLLDTPLSNPRKFRLLAQFVIEWQKRRLLSTEASLCSLAITTQIMSKTLVQRMNKAQLVLKREEITIDDFATGTWYACQETRMIRPCACYDKLHSSCVKCRGMCLALRNRRKR